ncbi:hypothetical protein N2W54_005068 [Lotmaria passim]
MDFCALTLIASYYAVDVDPDIPQSSTSTDTVTHTRHPPTAPGSITSNLFLRYFPPRVNATLSNATGSSSLLSSLSSCGSLEHAIPLAFSAAHPQARLAAESSPAGYSGGGVLIWNRPLSAASLSPLSLQPHRLRGLRTRRSDKNRGGHGGQPSHRWGCWHDVSNHGSGDNEEEEEEADHECSNSSSSTMESSSCCSSRSSSLDLETYAARRVVPPAPLFFSPTMLQRVPSAYATAESVEAHKKGNGKEKEGKGGAGAVHCPPVTREPYTLPSMTKVVVVLHLYDPVSDDPHARLRRKTAEWNQKSEGVGRSSSSSSRRCTDADDDRNTVWDLLRPVMWWLERSVRPADDAAHLTAAVQNTVAHHDSDNNDDGHSLQRTTEDVEGRRSADVAGAGVPATAAIESEAELSASQNLSLCSSSLPSTTSSAVAAAAVPPKLSCAIRLFLSPWAMPRRRRQIPTTTSFNENDGTTNSAQSALQFTTRRRPSSVSPPSSPATAAGKSSWQWCPRAVVELGLCGPGSDSPVLFSAATFLAALSLNSNSSVDGPDTSYRTTGHQAWGEGDVDEESQLRRRRRWRLRRSSGSGVVIPAFGTFPTPHVPSGPQWPGGGSGRRGVATWRTPACATLPTQQRSTAPAPANTTTAADAMAAKEACWATRPLLELLSPDGVWGSAPRDSARSSKEEGEQEDGSRESDGCALKTSSGAAETETQTAALLLSSLLKASSPSLPSHPLVPLHTLDLSFRTDLRQLEALLTRWAASGHLSRLVRLSLMGCIQLRHLDWLADMPADTLELLNVSGCEELRDLHSVRRLSALRSVKATQLIQLEQLGWWWGWDDEEDLKEDYDHETRASANEDACKGPHDQHRRGPPQLSSHCRLSCLLELDLACHRRRTHCLLDLEWIGTLSSLQRLAVSVGEEEDPLRQPTHHLHPHNSTTTDTRLPPATATAAATAVTTTTTTTRLAWLAGCENLRELRLAFSDGPPPARAPIAENRQRPAPLPILRLFSASHAEHGGRHATVAAAAAATAHMEASSSSDLGVLALFPFPHLRALDLTKAVLTENFTAWLAGGCPRLRSLDLTSCTFRCSRTGLRQAQAEDQLTAVAAAKSVRHGSHHSKKEETHPRCTRASPPVPQFPPTVVHSPLFAFSAAAATGHGQQRQRGGTTQGRAPHVSSASPRRPEHRIDAGDGDDAPRQRREEEQWWWRQLCHLPRLRRLVVYDLEGLTQGSSLDWAVGCAALRDLALRRCRWLLDAYAVHRLPRLRSLNLNATGIDDLTFLRMRDGAIVAAPPLPARGWNERLALRASAAATTGQLQTSSPSFASPDRSPAMAALCAYPRQLQRLLLSSPTDLPPSSNTLFSAQTAPPTLQHYQRQHHLMLKPALSGLTELVLVDCPFLSDLSPLAYLTSCRALFASDHLVTCLDYLSTCVSLEKLYLINYTKLSDLSALRWLWRLRVVYITHSSVRDVSWVAQPITTEMRARRCCSHESATHNSRYGDNDSSGGSSNSVSSADAAAARSRSDTAEDDGCALPHLEVLTLAYSRLLTDVSALGALPRLRHLDLRDCVRLCRLGTSARGEIDTISKPSSSSSDDGNSTNSRGEWALRHLITVPLSWAGKTATHAAAQLRRLRVRAASGWVIAHHNTTSAVPISGDASSTAAATAHLHDEQGADEQDGQQRGQAALPTPLPPTSSSCPRFPVSRVRSAHGLRRTLTPCSLAQAAPTLRYVSLSGCQALVDATALGDLHQLQYLHAAFTGIREVWWVSRCTSLKVLDLTMSPCCTPGAPSATSAVTFLARLPDELTELEIVNGRPVEREHSITLC